MFKIIQGLPQHVLGVKAIGTVTQADYKKILVPSAQKKLSLFDKITLLYVADSRFRSYDAQAVWSDMSFGLRHWRDFHRIAVVTDTRWLRNTVKIFAPFFPGKTRIFPVSQYNAAMQWIGEKGSKKGVKA